MSTIPKIIAHRGASGYAPENTLAAFKKAYDLGFYSVEFDVVLTKDEVPVIFHDATTTRTTNLAQRQIADLTLEEIKCLDAGSWFSADFQHEPIPTLAQTLEFLLSHKMQANIEIKPTRGLEIKTGKIAMDIIQNYYSTQDELPFISSFAIESVETVHHIAPEYPISFLKKIWDEKDIPIIKSLQCKTVNLNYCYINSSTINSIHNLGCAVLCYTINNKFLADKLFNWGVDGVFTNFPDKLTSTYKKGKEYV